MTKANLKRLEEGKLYYSISEVCSMTGLEQHVLRYWESEFPQLRPKKNRAGNRAYRAKEIKVIRYIKYLLYQEMYTIPGAKKKMADADMSDLDGQLTLLRVPPDSAPPSNGGKEAGEGTATAHFPPSAGNAFAAGAGDGMPDAVDKLREELRRVRNELKSLLETLPAPLRSSNQA